MEGTIFSNSSVTEHMMDKSFDDDRRNTFEQVKALLIAKLQTISSTLNDIDLSQEIENIKGWDYDLMHPIAQVDKSHKSINKSRDSRRRIQDNMIESAPSLKNLNTVRTHNSYSNNNNLIVEQTP